MPKANRISMYDKDNEYDLFLSREDLVDFQEIGEGITQLLVIVIIHTVCSPTHANVEMLY